METYLKDENIYYMYYPLFNRMTAYLSTFTNGRSMYLVRHYGRKVFVSLYATWPPHGEDSPLEQTLLSEKKFILHNCILWRGHFWYLNCRDSSVGRAEDCDA